MILEDWEGTFPRRVNASFEIEDDLRARILDSNHSLVDLGNAEIDFGYPTYHLPHITILMGRVDSQSDLLFVASVLAAHAQQLEPFEYFASAPYRAPGSAFVFCDVSPSDKIVQFRRSIDAALKGRLHYDMHGGIDNPPHITVGYLSNGNSVSALPRTPLGAGFAESIQLCDAGRRGVCLRRLWVSRLKKG